MRIFFSGSEYVTRGSDRDTVDLHSDPQTLFVENGAFVFEIDVVHFSMDHVFSRVADLSAFKQIRIQF